MDPNSWEDVDSNNGVMISNLPLLFSHGLPTTLNMMTVSELLTFIPFMVQCSVGEPINVPWSQLPRPNWWPLKLPFRIPSGRTPSATRILLVKLVERCYSFHGCQYLLQFCCSVLKQQPLSGYKFSDNRDGTTSMYNGDTGKLLVTFRNENREYDKVCIENKNSADNNKKLLRSPSRCERSGGSYSGLSPHGSSVMVQPPVSDIYLCEKCDDEFTSFKEVQAHERICQGGRSDSPQLASLDHEMAEVMEDESNQVSYLSYFDLLPATHTGLEPYKSPRKNHQFSPPSKLFGHNYMRYESIPLSSPLGKYLLKNSKYGSSFQASQQQILRYERYIPASPDVEYITAKGRCNRWMIVHRTEAKETWTHIYSFNCHQRVERLKTIETGLTSRSQKLLLRCKQCKVMLHRVSKRVIDRVTHKRTLSVPCIDLTVDDMTPQIVEEKKMPCFDTPKESLVDFLPFKSFPSSVTVSVVKSNHSSEQIEGKLKFPNPLEILALIPDNVENVSQYSPGSCSKGLNEIKNYRHPRNFDKEKSLCSENVLKNLSLKGTSFQGSHASMVSQAPHTSHIEVIDISSDDDDDDDDDCKSVEGGSTDDLSQTLDMLESEEFKCLPLTKNYNSHWSSQQSCLFYSLGRCIKNSMTNGSFSQGVPFVSCVQKDNVYVRDVAKNLLYSVKDKAEIFNYSQLVDSIRDKLNYPLFAKYIRNNNKYRSSNGLCRVPFQVDKEVSFLLSRELSSYQSTELQTLDYFSKENLNASNNQRCSMLQSDKNRNNYTLGHKINSLSATQCCILSGSCTKRHKYNALNELHKLMRDECKELSCHGLHDLVHADSGGIVTRAYLKKYKVSNSIKRRRQEWVKNKKIKNAPENSFQDEMSLKGKNKENKSVNTMSLCTLSIAKTDCLPEETTEVSDLNNTDNLLKLTDPLVSNSDLLTKNSSSNFGIVENDLSPFINPYAETAHHLSLFNIPKEDTPPPTPPLPSPVQQMGNGLTSKAKSKRKRYSRELSSLAADECKELKRMGFHPSYFAGKNACILKDFDDNENTQEPVLSKQILKMAPLKHNKQNYNESNALKDKKPKLPRAVLNLLKDECKELKQRGFNPLKLTKDSMEQGSSKFLLRSATHKERNRKDHKVYAHKFSSRIDKIHEGLSKMSVFVNTRSQLRNSPCIPTDTPRMGHRNLLKREQGMCVINYNLPLIR